MIRQRIRLRHRFLTMVLAICMVLQIVPPEAVFAADTVVFAGTAEELPAQINAGTTVELTADIILDPSQQITLLAGTLDGKGHTITLSDMALAQVVTGTVQNLGIAAQSSIGGTGGWPSSNGAVATKLTGGTIQNCFVTAEITSLFDDNGGFAGISEGGTVRNSYFAGKAPSNSFGGILGASRNTENKSTLTDCYYTGVDVPVSAGNAYNEQDTGMRSAEQMRTAAFAQLLNHNLPATGYHWTGADGQLPVLEKGGQDVRPDTDKQGLQAAIEAAQALTEDQYTSESWQALQTALSHAREVLENTQASQEEIGAAHGALQNALDGLQEKPAQIRQEPVELPAEGVVEITSQDQLLEMTQENSKGKFYRLASDLVIDTPYWFGELTFAGVLDGDGHCITVKNNTPIFNTLTKDSVIQNTGFLGAVKSGNDTGLLAKDGSGLIVNCWSRAEVVSEGMNGRRKNTGGFLANLNGSGAVVNCYVAGNVFNKGTVGDGVKGAFAAISQPGTLVKNCFWLNTAANAAVGTAEGQVTDSSSQNRGGFYSRENLAKLNAGRGAFGKVWTVDDDGWFHLGAEGSFNPELGSGLLFTYADIYGKAPVPFSSGEGLELSLEDFLLPAGTQGDMPKYVGYFSNPNFDGEIVCVPDYVGVGQGNHTVLVSQDCGLHIQNAGSVTVHVYDKSSWSGTAFEKELTSFTVVITPIEAEDLRLTPHGKFVTGNQVAGSGNVSVHGEVKVNGEWKKAPSTMLAFAVQGEIFGEGDGFYATAPGEITVTASGFGREAALKMESTYVPVQSIRPFPHGLHFIHERNANSAKLGDFLDLELADHTGRVDVRPENASYRNAWKLESSDPKVAEYIPDFLLAVLPYKAGKITLTATSLDPRLTAPVTGSTELELQYLNPVTGVSVNLQELDTGCYDSDTGHILLTGEGDISLPIHFTGTKPAEMHVDPNDGIEKEFSWHVSEPEMIWTQEGAGQVEIIRSGNLGMWVKTPLENCVANDSFLIRGLVNGTVTVTGVPADKTNTVEPVVFTVEVSGVQEPEPYDIEGFIAQAMPSAIAGVYSGIHYQCGSDEWQVLSLLRAGEQLPQDRLDAYYQSIVDTLAGWKPNRKPTDYERVALALGIMGKDITQVGTVNLAERIYNHKYLGDGSNEVAFALLALDACRTEIPADARNTRESMVELLLSFQNPDGGFGLAPGSSSGADTTSMALQALAPYQDQAAVGAAIENGLVYLKNEVHTQAGHFDEGTVEANAQTILAMAVLGRDILKEPGFSSVRYNLMQALEPYHISGEGFMHTAGDGRINAMATAQALQALDAYDRFLSGKSAYWNFTDAPMPERNPDAHQAATVMDAIHKLPEAEMVTQKDRDAIQAARAAYEALTPEQQALVDIRRLTAAEQALENLDQPNGDRQAADAVIAQIAALPEQIQLGDKPAVQAARAAYDKLTPAQKKLVNNYNKLTSAEAVIAGLESGEPAQTNEVYFSAERFVLGQGFVTEPVVVAFEDGDTYADILDKVLGDRASIRDNHNYLEMIRQANLGPDMVEIPAYIVEMSRNAKGEPVCSTEIVRNFYQERGYDAWPDAGDLGEFSYSASAGWMYSVNGAYPGTGIGETAAQPGAVVRVQYTVYGLGLDVKGTEQIPVARMDALIRSMAKANMQPDSIREYTAVKEAYAKASAAVKNVSLTAESIVRLAEELDAAVEEAVQNAPEHTHSYIWHITTLPTSEAAGLATGICACGHTITKELPRLQKEDQFSVTSSADNDLAGSVEAAALQHLPLTENEKQAVVNGEPLTASLQIRDWQDRVTQQDRQTIAAAAKGQTPAMYLDITLYKQVGTGEKTAVSDLNGEIAVSLQLPEGLWAEGRSYGVVRMHNGKAELLKCTLDETAQVLTFFTDAFSTYALTYADKPVEPEPTVPETTAPETIPPESVPETTVPEETTQPTTAPEKPNPDAGDGKPAEAITDPASQVTVKGDNLQSDMELVVNLLGKEHPNVSLMRKAIPSSKGLLRIYDVSLADAEGNPVSVSNGMVVLPVPRKLDGMDMQVLYCVNGKVITLEGRTENGSIEVPFAGSGSFGLVVPISKPAVTPQTGDAMPVVLLGNVCLAALAGALLLAEKKRRNV